VAAAAAAIYSVVNIIIAYGRTDREKRARVRVNHVRLQATRCGVRARPNVYAVCICVYARARARVTWLEPGLLRLSEVRQHRPHVRTRTHNGRIVSGRRAAAVVLLQGYIPRAPNAAAASSYTARAFSLNRYATPRARARPVRRSDPKNQCRPPRRTTTITAATHTLTYTTRIDTNGRRRQANQFSTYTTLRARRSASAAGRRRRRRLSWWERSRRRRQRARARVCVKRRRSRRPARHRWPLVIGKLPALFVARDTERVRRNRINQTRARALCAHTRT